MADLDDPAVLAALQRGGAPTSSGLSPPPPQPPPQLHLPEGQTGGAYVDPRGEVYAFGGPSLGLDTDAARANEPALDPELYPEIRPRPEGPLRPRLSELTQDVAGVPMGVSSPGAPTAPGAQPPQPPRGRSGGVGMGGGGLYGRLAALRGVPTEYRGGHLLPVGREELEAEWARIDAEEEAGRLTEAEADARRDYLGRNWAKWQESPDGLQARLQRAQVREQEANVDYQRRELERGAELEGTIGRRQAELADEVRTQEQIREMQRQASEEAREQQMAAWRRAQKEADAFRIDPDRYMSSQSGWSQVRLTLATMLGAGAQGLSRGRMGNAPLEILERRIDRDIDAQTKELSSKRAAADGQSQLLATMRAQYQDDEQAALGAKRFLLEQAQREISAALQGDKPASFVARGQRLMQQLEEKKEQLGLQQQLAAEETKRAELMALMRPRGGRGRGKSKVKQDQKTQGARDMERFIGSQAKVARDALDKLHAMGPLEGRVDGRHAALIARYQTAMRTINNMRNEAQGQGKLSIAEDERWENSVEMNPTVLDSVRGDKGYRIQRDALDNAVRGVKQATDAKVARDLPLDRERATEALRGLRAAGIDTRGMTPEQLQQALSTMSGGP